MSDTHLSKAAHERLRAELEDLTTRGRVEIAQAIEAARSLGDLKENGDYHAAKDTQGKMEARVRQIERLLSEAQIVEEGTNEAGGTVQPGSIVTVRFEGDDDTERFLVGSIEERVEGVDITSPSSPLGQALVGKRKGDVVQYETPKGLPLKVEIVDVGS